jgi:hypothetical protein
VFGANSGDKIKLSTIFIQHFKSLGINFNSLIVLSNAEELPRKDLTRLQKVADNIAPMIDDKENIKSKIIKMVA